MCSFLLWKLGIPQMAALSTQMCLASEAFQRMLAAHFSIHDLQRAVEIVCLYEMQGAKARSSPSFSVGAYGMHCMTCMHLNLHTLSLVFSSGGNSKMCTYNPRSHRNSAPPRCITSEMICEHLRPQNATF